MPDFSLVSKAQSGDRAAFEALVSEHQGAVYAFVASRTRDADLAQDLTQRAFVEAFICIRTLRDPAKFASWTKGIANNLWRKSQSERQIATDPGELERLAERDMRPELRVLTTTETPDVVYEKTELKAIILAEVHNLDPSLSEVVYLHYMEGLSYKEISAILDLPLSTIVGRLQSARQKLKDNLIPYVEETLQDERPEVRDKVMALLPLTMFQTSDWVSSIKAAVSAKAVAYGGVAAVLTVGSFIGFASIVNHANGQPTTSKSVTMEIEATRPEAENVPDRIGELKSGEGPSMKIKYDETRTRPSIDYSVTEPSQVTVNVYNRTGELVQVASSGQHETGRYSVTLETEGWRKGTYFTQLKYGNATKDTRKLLIGFPKQTKDQRASIRAASDLLKAAFEIQETSPKLAIEMYDRVLANPDYLERGHIFLSSLGAHAIASPPEKVHALVDSTLSYGSSPGTRLTIAQQVAGIQADPSKARPYADLAMEQVQAALADIRKESETSNPKLTSLARYAEGMLLARRGDYPDAIASFDRAIGVLQGRLDESKLLRAKREFSLYSQLGLTHEKAGNPEMATEALKTAKRLHNTLREPGQGYIPDIRPVDRALKRLR